MELLLFRSRSLCPGSYRNRWGCSGQQQPTHGCYSPFPELLAFTSHGTGNTNLLHHILPLRQTRLLTVCSYPLARSTLLSRSYLSTWIHVARVLPNTPRPLDSSADALPSSTRPLALSVDQPGPKSPRGWKPPSVAGKRTLSSTRT